MGKSERLIGPRVKKVRSAQNKILRALGSTEVFNRVGIKKEKVGKKDQYRLEVYISKGPLPPLHDKVVSLAPGIPIHYVMTGEFVSTENKK